MAKPGRRARGLAGKIAVVTILIVATTWSGRAEAGQAGTARSYREGRARWYNDAGPDRTYSEGTLPAGLATGGRVRRGKDAQAFDRRNRHAAHLP